MKKNLWILATVCLLALTGCTSFEDIKQQADAGNADMQFKAAVMLMNGDGTEVDHNAAEKYMTAAFKAKNQSAACHVIKDIQRNSRGDQAKLLMEAYDILFEKKVYSAPEKLEIMADFPEYIIKYILYLDANGYNASAFAVKQYALKNVGKCPLRSRYIRRYAQKIKSYKTAFEKAEEKRIAEEKRRFQEKKRKAEEKRIAEEKRRFQEEKRKAEEKRIAEEKRKAEEKRIAEEKAKYPLKTTGYTPMRLYKNIYSGVSRKYFYKAKLNQENDNKITPLWEDSFFTVRYKDFSVTELPKGHIYREYVALSPSKQLKKVNIEYRSDIEHDFDGRITKGYVNYNEYAFLIGVEFNFYETQNVTIQSFIDKFKKDYPDLKQQGTLHPQKSSNDKSEKIEKQIADIYQKLNTLKNKLLPPNIYKLSQKEVEAVKLEIFKLHRELVYKTQTLSLQASTAKKPELKLYNDNILIVFIKSGDYITVTIKDAKLVKYRKQLDSEFRNAIKEYNKQGEQKKKQKEMQQLDF